MQRIRKQKELLLLKEIMVKKQTKEPPSHSGIQLDKMRIDYSKIILKGNDFDLVEEFCEIFHIPEGRGHKMRLGIFLNFIKHKKRLKRGKK